MDIKFEVLKDNCKMLEWDLEDEWCSNNKNPRVDMYCSCNEENCPLKE